VRKREIVTSDRVGPDRVGNVQAWLGTNVGFGNELVGSGLVLWVRERVVRVAGGHGRDSIPPLGPSPRGRGNF